MGEGGREHTDGRLLLLARLRPRILLGYRPVLRMCRRPYSDNCLRQLSTQISSHNSAMRHLIPHTPTPHTPTSPRPHHTTDTHLLSQAETLLGLGTGCSGLELALPPVLRFARISLASLGVHQLQVHCPYFICLFIFVFIYLSIYLCPFIFIYIYSFHIYLFIYKCLVLLVFLTPKHSPRGLSQREEGKGMET